MEGVPVEQAWAGLSGGDIAAVVLYFVLILGIGLWVGYLAHSPL